MSETYHERLIKRETTVTDIAIRTFFVLLCFMPVVFIRFVGGFAIILIVGLIWLAHFMFVLTDVEFEYLYLSGECQFDKICGKTKRKGCGKIEMEKVEIIAPEGAAELENFEKQSYRVRDFSSYSKDAERYVAFQRKDSALIKVIFEPGADIIREMQLMFPRKVIVSDKYKGL